MTDASDDCGVSSAMDENVASIGAKQHHPSFAAAATQEFVSALVVIPIIWILARLLQTESGSVELIAAPVILAWFTVRGWKTEDDPLWPTKLPIWQFIPRFLLATTIVVGLPLLIFGVVLGFVRLVQFHRQPMLLISIYAAAIIVSFSLIWIGRRNALRLITSWLGLSDTGPFTKARFAFYWLVSLAFVAIAIWPEPVQFDALCDQARNAGLNDPVPSSVEQMQFSECVIKRRGAGYAVTIGAVLEKGKHSPSEIIHYSAIMYPGGGVHHLERYNSDPRGQNSIGH
jgi:hypothetical protein